MSLVSDVAATAADDDLEAERFLLGSHGGSLTTGSIGGANDGVGLFLAAVGRLVGVTGVGAVTIDGDPTTTSCLPCFICLS